MHNITSPEFYHTCCSGRMQGWLRQEGMPPSVGRIALRSISGRKAGKDHARSQCPEEHPGTQGPLRGEGKLASQAPPGQSLLRKGQSRLRRGQSLQAVARKTTRTQNPFRKGSSATRAEEPSLGKGYIVRVRKIGLIGTG
ncbi:hypothetical protein V511_10230 [Mesotoga sp. Brook.08.YT.4.2.5.1]|nr:hypothetical protein V511_10230 [Mesotoga sp. Brook.08.YT.4.2.5.1]PNS40791.1 hypothetical protein RJ60_06190 [Mesotoga sp. B105.6.4]RAO96730.1 hypothetical protein M388_13210 [Mesotoga sp. Brook.08.YT.4.2.5.4.]RDI93316.1 hypothetical protein Q502_06535 [Mesotoga sp. Brook.08.YT.4.2.5.2.]